MADLVCYVGVRVRHVNSLLRNHNWYKVWPPAFTDPCFIVQWAVAKKSHLHGRWATS